MRQIRSWYSLARLAGELEVAKTWKDEGQSCCTETTSELEHDTQIASQKRNDHSSYDETRGKDEMAVAIEFACEEVGLENLAANKAFERQGGEHVQTNKTSSDIDNDVVVWEVVLGIRGAERTQRRASQVPSFLSSHPRVSKLLTRTLLRVFSSKLQYPATLIVMVAAAAMMVE